VDIILRAIQQSAVAELPATGIIINTNDWYDILTLKDAEGRYIIPGGPLSNAPARLWQLPVVYTNAMPVGHFLAGAFKTAATIYDREEASVVASTEDRDNFVKNLVTLLAEERLAMAVKRPEALIYGSF
jgi:HK97 family phage major capsid protein